MAIYKGFNRVHPKTGLYVEGMIVLGKPDVRSAFIVRSAGIRQSGNNPRLPLRQCATHETGSRSDIPGRYDGAGRAEVEADGDVLGGEIIRKGNVR